MGFDLKARKEKTKTVTITTVDTDGDPLTIEYKPHALTPNIQREISKLTAAAEGTEENVAWAAKWLMILVYSWNATDGGKPVAISEEVFNNLDFELLNAILTAINADMGLNTTDPNSTKR